MKKTMPRLTAVIMGLALLSGCAPVAVNTQPSTMPSATSRNTALDGASELTSLCQKYISEKKDNLTTAQSAALDQKYYAKARSLFTGSVTLNLEISDIDKRGIIRFNEIRYPLKNSLYYGLLKLDAGAAVDMTSEQLLKIYRNDKAILHGNFCIIHNSVSLSKEEQDKYKLCGVTLFGPLYAAGDMTITINGVTYTFKQNRSPTD